MDFADQPQLSEGEDAFGPGEENSQDADMNSGDQPQLHTNKKIVVVGPLVGWLVGWLVGDQFGDRHCGQSPTLLSRIRPNYCGDRPKYFELWGHSQK